MEGIYFVKDESGKDRFVQIDLSLFGEAWEDFYDILLAEKARGEDSISFKEFKNQLKIKRDLEDEKVK